MNAFFRLLVVILLSGCAGDGGTVPDSKKKQFETFTLGANHFAIREDYVLHTITPREWSRRTELGIPADARKCSGPYYLYFRTEDGEKGTVIGLVTEGKRKRLTAIEPRMYFSDTLIEKTRLFSGAFVRYGQLADYLFIPPAQFVELLECATRDEMHT
jgi:hypothetical protein